MAEFGAQITFCSTQSLVETARFYCFLRDPNGYLIEIQRFEDPRWTSRSAS